MKRAKQLAIPALLAIFLLYLALRGVDWSSVGHTVMGARWSYLVGGLCLTILAVFLRSYRWRILLNAEADLSVGTVFWATASGYLGNLVLPARAGEILRTLLIGGRSQLATAYILTTALGERVMDAIALIVCSSLALVAVQSQMTSRPTWMAPIARTMAIAAVTCALVIAALPRIHGFLERILHSLPLPEGLRNALLRILAQVILGLRAFHSASRFGGFAALTVVIWSLDCTGSMIVASALGLHISFPVALLFITALGLGSALPSTPGYLGIYQFVAVTVLGPFGIGRESAIAYVIVSQALGSLVVLVCGFTGLFRLGAGLSMLRKVQEP